MLMLTKEQKEQIARANEEAKARYDGPIYRCPPAKAEGSKTIKR